MVDRVMTTLRIFDLEGGALALDLRDLMRLLAPASLHSTWTITSTEEGFEAIGKGGVRLEELAEIDAQVSGGELLDLAEDTVQVIWGEFIGMAPGAPHQKWVTMRAIDSSYWEIITSDEVVLEKVRTAYADVQPESDASPA